MLMSQLLNKDSPNGETALKDNNNILNYKYSFNRNDSEISSKILRLCSYRKQNIMTNVITHICILLKTWPCAQYWGNSQSKGNKS